jgi:hypothetical protein
MIRPSIKLDTIMPKRGEMVALPAIADDVRP